MLICETRFGGPSVAGYQMNDDLPPGHAPFVDDHSLIFHCVGSCLDPIARDRDMCFASQAIPQPWQVVGFMIRGETMGRLKIFLGIHDRAGVDYPLFGENQPDRLVAVLAVQPLSVMCIAERDIEWMYPVHAIHGVDGERDVESGVTIAPEQWDAVQRAVAA